VIQTILDEQTIRTRTANGGRVKIITLVFCLRKYALVSIVTFRGIYSEISITQNKGEVLSGERESFPASPGCGVRHGVVGVINIIICCDRGNPTQCSETIDWEYAWKGGPHVRAKKHPVNNKQDLKPLYEISVGRDHQGSDAEAGKDLNHVPF
jgi:hypothetical protein